MPFRYMAIDSSGNQARGLLEAETEEAAERALWDRGLTILNLERVAAPFNLATVLPTFLGPKRQDLIIFSQQLASLIDSGVSLVPALDLLSEEVTSQPLRVVLRRVVADLRLGAPLSTALSRHEMVFPPIYCRLMEVGERTGNLGFVLRQLATYLEKEESVVRKIRGALGYPLFLIAMAIGVLVIVFNFTLPPLLNLYAEFDAELPWPTQVLISAAEFFVAYRFFLFIGVMLLLVLGFWYLSRPTGRRQLDWLLLRLPLIGRITTQGAIARFSRTLSTLLTAGVSLPDSLELAREVVGNVVMRQAVEDLRQEALQGRGLSRPIARNRLFPGLLSQMVRVGEETGTLDNHLASLSNFYEEEVDRATKRLTGMLEPAMILFVGLIVGFVAISVVLPMYSLLQSIR
ncbi:MAG TPA: type II secretion system F family protein [Anaerolineales bacterium]|jgi:type IV pilus assembly protein PilC